MIHILISENKIDYTSVCYQRTTNTHEKMFNIVKNNYQQSTSLQKEVVGKMIDIIVG
jgi:hypothetical protein